MANKRIELEQYKCYVNLFEEEPNRKMIRSGVTVVMVAASLLVLLLLVLGLLSGSLAKNPSNVLEKPPAPTPSGTTPGQVSPGVNIPGQQQLPQGVPSPTGGAVPLARASGTDLIAGDAPALPSGALDGALLAQAGGGEVSQVVTPAASTPTQPASTSPVTSTAKKAGNPGPGKQTKGVGNLSNLANKISGRGLHFYLMLLTVILWVLLYVAFARARKEGKAK
jgi:hypothetical protein